MDSFFGCMEEILDVPQGSIQPEDVLTSFQNFDSLALLQIIAELEEKYQVSIPMEEVKNIVRAGDFLKYLEVPKE